MTGAADVMMATVGLAVVLLAMALSWWHTTPTPQLLRIRRNPTPQERAAAARRAAEDDS